jgi:hypothetical protein
MGQQGYALTEKVDTEIVSAYAASQQNVPGVNAAPGWFKIGSFYLPKNLKRTRLEMIGHVSFAGLVATARLYDPTTGVDAPVSGSDAVLSSLSDARVLSGSFELVGNRSYLIMAQCVGSSGPSKFAVVNTASLVGS